MLNRNEILRLNLLDENEQEKEEEEGEHPMPTPNRPSPTRKLELKTNGNRRLFIATNLGTYVWRGLAGFALGFLGLNQFNLIPWMNKFKEEAIIQPNLTEEDCIDRVIQELVNRRLITIPSNKRASTATGKSRRNDNSNSSPSPQIRIPEDSRVKPPRNLP